MAKSKNFLFGFDARGSIANLLTFRHRDQQTIAEKKPVPKDAKTSGQLAWRTMYQLCADLWHTLTPVEQATWETLARRQHMTGYAYYLSQCLRPNPGIYLPLAGGSMAGNIDMATKRILNLPAPVADEEPLRKIDGGGGGAPFDPFAQFLEFIPWLTLDCFTLSGDGASYVIAAQYPYLTLVTDTNTDNDVIIGQQWIFEGFNSPGKLVTIEFPIFLISPTLHIFWLRLDAAANDPPGDIDSHCGWQIINSRIYASNADGLNQTITDTGIDIVAFAPTIRLKMIINPASYIKFYVNDTLVATHSTNLPTLDDHGIILQLRTKQDAQTEYRILRLLIQKQY